MSAPRVKTRPPFRYRLPSQTPRDVRTGVRQRTQGLCAAYHQVFRHQESVSPAIRGGHSMAFSHSSGSRSHPGRLARWVGAALGVGAAAIVMSFGGLAVLAATTVNLETATSFA